MRVLADAACACVRTYERARARAAELAERARARVRACMRVRVLADARARVHPSARARALARCIEFAVPSAGSCESRSGRRVQRKSGSVHPFCPCGQSCARLREYAHGSLVFNRSAKNVAMLHFRILLCRVRYKGQEEIWRLGRRALPAYNLRITNCEGIASSTFPT